MNIWTKIPLMKFVLNTIKDHINRYVPAAADQQLREAYAFKS